MNGLTRQPAVICGACLIVFVLLAAVAAPWLSSRDPRRIVQEEQLLAPGSGHPFGTDALGRDVYAAVLHGARVSVAIGLGAVAIAVVLGVPLGAVSGYFAVQR